MSEKQELSEADLDRAQGATGTSEWKYVPVRRFAVIGQPGVLATQDPSVTSKE